LGSGKAAFRAKGLNVFSGAWGVRTRNQRLHFCIDMFRQTTFIELSRPKHGYIQPQEVEKGKLILPFVNGNNMQHFKELFRCNVSY
jgi:hypothetical protein